MTDDDVWRKHEVFEKRAPRTRGLERRLGGALAAQRAVSDRSWMYLAACSDWYMMEVTLGHHGAILNFAAAELRADITQVPE